MDGADWPDILVIPPSKSARSNEACARICQSTPGCNYAVLVNALRCYPKTLSGSPPQPSYFYDNVTIVIPEGSDLACGAPPGAAVRPLHMAHITVRDTAVNVFSW